MDGEGEEVEVGCDGEASGIVEDGEVGWYGVEEEEKVRVVEFSFVVAVAPAYARNGSLADP